MRINGLNGMSAILLLMVLVSPLYIAAAEPLEPHPDWEHWPAGTLWGAELSLENAYSKVYFGAKTGAEHVYLLPPAPVPPWIKLSLVQGGTDYAEITRTADSSYTWYVMFQSSAAQTGLTISAELENATRWFVPPDFSVVLENQAQGIGPFNLRVENGSIDLSAWAPKYATLYVDNAVNVTISPSENTAAPGYNATFTVTVTNTGRYWDNYTLSATDTKGWSLSLDESYFGNVENDTSRTTTLHVTIGDGIDEVTVTASGVYASDNATATAFEPISVQVSPEENNAVLGENATFTVTVTNKGDTADTYSLGNTDTLGWAMELENTVLTVPAGENRTTTLTVTASPTATPGTVDNVTVIATSQTNSAISDNDNCRIKALSAEPKFRVLITPSENSALPGENASFTVTVVNETIVPDNYSLENTDTLGWAMELENTVLENVGPGENRQTVLRVTIPYNAIGGTEDNITVTAISDIDPTKDNKNSCIAHVKIFRDVEVLISPSEENVPQGATQDYQVTVKNKGNVADNYLLVENDNQGWTLVLADNLLEVQAYGENTTTLSVTVPENAVTSTEDNIIVTATSQTDNTVSAENSCIAHVAPLFLRVEVSISPRKMDSVPGENLPYVVTVTNTGRAPDNYALEVSDNAGWTLALDNNLFENVAPDESRKTTLWVTIPENATPSTEDNITVTATSQTDNTVSAENSCIAHVIQFKPLATYPTWLHWPSGTLWGGELSLENAYSKAYFGVKTGVEHKYKVPPSPPPPWIKLSFYDGENELAEITMTQDIPPQSYSWYVMMQSSTDQTGLTLSADLENVTHRFLSHDHSVILENQAQGIGPFNLREENGLIDLVQYVEKYATLYVDNAVNIEIENFTPTTAARGKIIFDVIVSNTGRYNDTYELSASDNLGWGLVFSPSTLSVSAGQSETATLAATITSVGTNEITVTANGAYASDYGKITAFGPLLRHYKAYPTDDQVVMENRGNLSDNYKFELPSGRYHLDNYPRERSFLKFDISSIKIPLLGTIEIENAYLGLYHRYGVYTEGRWSWVEVWTVENDNWTENEIDWSNQPPKIENLYQEYINYTGFSPNPWLGTINGWPGVPVKSYIENEIVNGVASFVLYSPQEDVDPSEHTDVDFTAKEDLNYPEQRPYLEVWYYENAPQVSFSVSISPDYQEGWHMDTLEYAITVKNRGSENDNYDLVVSDNVGWNPTLSDNLLDNVPPGESRTVTLSVTIPEDAERATLDNITVTATSQTDNRVSDNASCIAYAAMVDFEVTISPSYQRGSPGEDFVYTVTVKNTGDSAQPKEHTLYVSDTAGWGPTLDDNLENIPSGGSWTTRLRVTIPDNATHNTRDNLTVEVRAPWENQNAGWVVKENSAIAHAETLKLFISPDVDSAVAGESLTFTVLVWNVGIENDNYTLEVTDDAGWISNWSSVFYSTSSDGHVSRNDTDYQTIRDATSGTVYDNDLDFGIGQLDISGSIFIFRGFVYFDTSSLPDHADITTATLSLYGKTNRSENDFDIVVQNGQPTYPHDPLESGDYDRTHYSDNGGSFNTSNFTTTGYNDIVLNENGRSWIRKDGITKFYLGSSRDINNIAPGDEEYVYFWSSEKGEGYKPKLTVAFRAISLPSLTLQPGESRPTTLRVTIPEGALRGTEDNVMVTVIPGADPAASESENCVAIAAPLRGVGVSVSPKSRVGPGGATITYAVIVKNFGTESDSYDLTVSDDAGWGDNITLSEDLLVVPGLERRGTILEVTIPREAAAGTVDNITVTATSQENENVSDSASCAVQMEIPAWIKKAIVRGDGTAYNLDASETEEEGDPPPEVWYSPGDYPPLMAAKRVENGAVVAAGLVSTLRNGRWQAPFDVLLDKTFQWMVPGAVNVLWYEGFGDTYYIYNNTVGCSQLVAALEALGYTVTGEEFKPITASELEPYDIMIVPELQIPIGNLLDGGDPSLLEDDDVQAIANFVKGGGGLLVMEGTDVHGYNYFKIQNKILTWLGVEDIYFQSDQVNQNGTFWFDAEVTDVDFGADYRAATGLTHVRAYSTTSLVIKPEKKELDVSLSIPSYLEGLPGETLTYTLTISNKGKLGDTYILNAADNAGFASSVSTSTMTLAAGASDNATLSVTIPEGTPRGTVSRITVAVTSVIDPTLGDVAYGEAWTGALGASVSISPDNRSGRPGENLKFYVYVTNTGDFDDNYTLTVSDHLGWGPKISPVNLTIPKGRMDWATLWVIIPESATSGAEDSITVTATSQTDNRVSAENSCIALVTPDGKGVNVSISSTSKSGAPGATLTYEVTVKNTGTDTDTFSLHVADTEGWGPTLSITSIPSLAGGASRTGIQLSVKIPDTAAEGDSTTITVTASGTGYDDSASCIARAVIGGVEISISPESRTGSLEETITFTVTVTNTREVEDSYDLTVSDTAGWGAVLSEDLLTVPAGEDSTTTVSVTVPSDATEGESTMITVKAASRDDPAVSNTATCTAEAREKAPLPIVPIGVGGAAIGGAIAVTLLVKKGMISVPSLRSRRKSMFSRMDWNQSRPSKRSVLNPRPVRANPARARRSSRKWL